MADREIELITKDEALKIRQSCRKLPGELLDKVNAIIWTQIEQGKEEIVFGKGLVENDLQWNSLLSQLMRSGWKVKEEHNQRNGDYVVLKF